MPRQATREIGPTIGGELFGAEEALAGKTAVKKTSPSERETLGQRLARLRKERGITQVELAERLGVAQPVVSDYERGELRLHGELIIRLTEILAVSAEELLGLQPPKSSSGHGLRNRRLLRRIQEIERLPKRD